MINYNKYLMKYRGKLRLLAKKCRENNKLIKAAAAVIVIAVAFVFFGDYGEKEKIKIPDASLSAEESEKEKKPSKRPEKKEEIIVDISGCIVKPGVYYVSADSRLCDIISLAGGLTEDADIDSINQAESVSDGQKLFIPSIQDKTSEGFNSGGNSLGSASSQGGKVNINTATFDELQTISGIGPATASSIIEYRTEHGKFASIEDIKNVSGIGEKTFEKLKDKITT